MQKNCNLQIKNEMDIPKVSIIVPVYNTERFLDRCIKSLIDQTYSNLELIFVDDGSTDSSLEIINSMQKIDKRIVVLRQENAGPSAARNKGIQYSSGEYILFCDSDDTVYEDWCRQLVYAVQNHPNAWVICGINVRNEMSEMMYKYQCTNGIYENKEYFSIFEKGLSGFVYNKIYRKDILEKYNIRFDVKRRRGEDVIFNLEYLARMKYIYCIQECYYNYFRYDTYQTITGQYYTDSYKINKDLYLNRLCFIAKKDEKNFKRYYWHVFWNELENTMNKNQKDSLMCRIQINQAIISDEVFRELLIEFGQEEADKYSFWCLKNKMFWLYWMIQKLHEIKIILKGL